MLYNYIWLISLKLCKFEGHCFGIYEIERDVEDVFSSL